MNIGYGYYVYTSTTRETDGRMKFANIAGRVEWEAEDRVHFFLTNLNCVLLKIMIHCKHIKTKRAHKKYNVYGRE